MRFRETRHPILYEINTRVWLADLSRSQGRKLTLSDIPEPELERLEKLGIDLVWLMGVWRTGEKSGAIARAHAGLANEFRAALPDVAENDVTGSCYAIAEYTVQPGLGGTKALAAFRNRLARSGIGLILDFVPNHAGIDHQWVTKRPDFFVQGTASDLQENSGTYFEVKASRGRKILAHGKDPYFPAWTDTAQFNFHSTAARSGLENVLRTIADQCDGVRCDMAMLAMEEVFAKTWGNQAAVGAEGPPASGEFWTGAINAVRQRYPGFLFLAEVYWGLEGKLQSLGFDYTYDKILYDRLRDGDARGCLAHLRMDLEAQRRCLRFLENHDEPRAAQVFPWHQHRAAALITSTVTGGVMFHEGQLEGRRLRIPVQLQRRAYEPIEHTVVSFYDALFKARRDPIFKQGEPQILETRPAWDGNPTWTNFIAYQWKGPDGKLLLITVNYGPTQGQCYVTLPTDQSAGSPFKAARIELVDLLSEEHYLRESSELLARGLYLDMPAYGIHLFRVEPRTTATETPAGE